MPRIKPLVISPELRFETGLIATVRDKYGKDHSRHFVGMVRDATRDLADWCDDLGATVLSISTPQSIYRDLHGSRRTMIDTMEKQRVSSYAKHTTDRLDLPEPKLLGYVGRMDLFNA